MIVIAPFADDDVEGDVPPPDEGVPIDGVMPPPPPPHAESARTAKAAIARVVKCFKCKVPYWAAKAPDVTLTVTLTELPF